MAKIVKVKDVLIGEGAPKFVCPWWEKRWSS